MSAFRIGGSPFRPAANAVGGGKRAKEREAPRGVPASGGAFDKASLAPNRLAVMPRMGAVGSQDTQCLRGEAVESLLRGAAAELDGYFTEAYGFGGDTE